MRLLSRTKGSGTVNSALGDVLKELNDELKGVDGLITAINCDLHAGPAGASVSISLVINGNEPRRKVVIGVNEKGINREHSMKKATNKFNELMKSKKGELVDVFVKTVVTPLPGRVYTTMMGAVNEVVLENAQDSIMRRQRIMKALELLNNDPAAINVASVAEVFGVSRTIIYKDLDTLGFNRAAAKELKNDRRLNRDPGNR
jgi:hypothetical protein